MTLTYDQLSSITEKKFMPKAVDNIFDSNPLLQRMKESGNYKKVDGGTSIIQPLEYAQNGSGGWYSGAELLDNTDTDVVTGAEYAWKQLYESISITGADERKNSGDAAKVDLVKTKVKNAEKTMADRLGTGLYSSSTVAKSIIGLGTIMSTSTTVGGISGTDYSWWRAQIDATNTTMTLSALQAIFNSASIGNDSPTVITSGRSRFNSFWNLLQPQQRFTDSKTANAGWASLMFNGTPWIVDSHAASTHVYMINEKYFQLVAHPQADMKFEPFQKPINQDVRCAKILWMGALCVSNRRMLGALTALTA